MITTRNYYLDYITLEKKQMKVTLNKVIFGGFITGLLLGVLIGIILFF